MSGIFEFLNQKTCDIVGHDWYRDFQKEAKTIHDPVHRYLFTGRNILNGTMAFYRCTRCKRLEFRGVED